MLPKNETSGRSIQIQVGEVYNEDRLKKRQWWEKIVKHFKIAEEEDILEFA